MRTVGVEEEFLVVSASSPALVAEGDSVVQAAEARSDGQFEHEFKRQQAELGTDPTASMTELGEQLRRRRHELAAAADSQGVRLLASGTSPGDEFATTTSSARYERMVSQFGKMAQLQLTCGMHVHVEVRSAAEGVGVLDRLRGWLALILALSANSPFVGGQDTEYASYRTVLWGQWPTAGTADVFGDIEGYMQARDALVASGAALDDGMIYFDARLSSRYPTVEVRVADVCARVEDGEVIAALVRGMVSTAAAEWADGVAVSPLRSELLRAATWRAARWGVDQDLVDVNSCSLLPAWEMIGRLVEWVRPALETTGDAALVEAGLASIERRGSGARLQRRAYEAGGVSAVADAVALPGSSLRR